MKQLAFNYQAPNPLLPKPVMPITFTKSSSSKYYCSDCDLAFIIERDLLNHCSGSNLGSYKQSSVVFNCSECTLQFTTFRGMKQHVGKIHSKKKNMPCELCGKLFKDKYAIKFHQEHVHNKTQKVKCEKCSLLCYTKYVYREHVKKCSIDTENY